MLLLFSVGMQRVENNVFPNITWSLEASHYRVVSPTQTLTCWCTAYKYSTYNTVCTIFGNSQWFIQCRYGIVGLNYELHIIL